MCVFRSVFVGSVLFVQCIGVTTASPEYETAYFDDLYAKCNDPRYWVLDHSGKFLHKGHEEVKLNVYYSYFFKLQLF